MEARGRNGGQRRIRQRMRGRTSSGVRYKRDGRFAEQGILLWYNLPSDHSSAIKAKIYNQVEVTDLNKEDGVDKFMNAMNEAFKLEDEVKAYGVFVEFFVDMKRKPEEQNIRKN